MTSIYQKFVDFDYRYWRRNSKMVSAYDTLFVAKDNTLTRLDTLTGLVSTGAFALLVRARTIIFHKQKDKS